MNDERKDLKEKTKKFRIPHSEFCIQKNSAILNPHSALKKGFTTGTCAQAAAKGASLMLLTQRLLRKVKVDTPSGVKLNLGLIDQKIEKESAFCGIVKDAGDDPDVTNGIKIYAEVKFSPKKGVTVIGGEGVGKVTKQGLAVGVGEYAINPVPRQMIIKEIEEIMRSLCKCGMQIAECGVEKIKKNSSEIRVPNSAFKKNPKSEIRNLHLKNSAFRIPHSAFEKGLEVVISVPRGEELTKHTFNPRLGIVGGISIIGTTGIVEPKSTDAYKTSLSLQLDVLKAEGCEKAVLILGYVGERFAKEALKVNGDSIIKIGDHVGFTLKECVKKKIKEVLLIGHVGKLVKITKGQFDTHSKFGDNRVETIAHYAKTYGAKRKVIEKLLSQTTAEATIDILRKNRLMGVFGKITQKVVITINDFLDNELTVSCILLSLGGKILAAYPKV